MEYNIAVGKDDFKNTINLKLPKGNRIGVLVSGGADSAILLYLLAKLNIESLEPVELIPFTVPKKIDNAMMFAESVVNYVNNLLDIKLDGPYPVGELDSHYSKIIRTGAEAAVINFNLDCIVFGSQQVPPSEFKMLGIYPNRPSSIDEHPKVYCPFALVDKRHTMDLYRIYDRLDLLSLTHSCTEKAIGRCNECFNCSERTWSLESIQISDPGQL
jgi:7-cyano-7-deazaguanine synthase in queuosine biosynthesis